MASRRWPGSRSSIHSTAAVQQRTADAPPIQHVAFAFRLVGRQHRLATGGIVAVGGFSVVARTGIEPVFQP